MPPKTEQNDTLASMVKKIQALEEANAKLQSQVKSAAKGRTMKVSAKGGLSIYGMGRFPVTLYAEQWETLLGDESVKEIKGFIESNRASFSTKADKAVREAKALTEGTNKGEGDKATAPNV